MFFKNGYLWRIANTEKQVVLLPLRSSAERPVSISLKFSQWHSEQLLPTGK